MTSIKKNKIISPEYLQWRRILKAENLDPKDILRILKEKQKVSEIAEDIINQYNLQKYL